MPTSWRGSWPRRPCRAEADSHAVHLARRSYVLVMLAAVLAILGIWSGDRDLTHLWQIPAGLLLSGLAIEAYFARRLRPEVHLQSPAHAFLASAPIIRRFAVFRKQMARFSPSRQH